MSQAFDLEFCEQVEEKFKQAGIKILTNTKVTAVGGEEKVEYVEINDTEKIEADFIVFSIGATPNTELAEKLGLRIEEKLGIWVDEYLRTSHSDIFAVGDCTAKTDFFTRRPTHVMLASTVCAEARIAGANLFALQIVRENRGTIGVFSTNLQGLTIASAGLIEKMATEQGFEIVTATSTSKDRHPGNFADTSDLKVKLIFSKYSGTILGGQVIGGKGAGEMINAIGIAIQEHMNESDLFTLQFGTPPLLTSAPTTYPLITAAQKALIELKKEIK